jgi:hypothetical protein
MEKGGQLTQPMFFILSVHREAVQRSELVFGSGLREVQENRRLLCGFAPFRPHFFCASFARFLCEDEKKRMGFLIRNGAQDVAFTIRALSHQPDCAIGP